MKSHLKKQIVGWLFIAVPVALVFLFYFYPMIQSFILSLQLPQQESLLFCLLGITISGH
ncbi:Uncharacterised protein [Chlamydia trachomatis]|nr:Uncharacterised protein [Chlamydia trachomatis]